MGVVEHGCDTNVVDHHFHQEVRQGGDLTWVCLDPPPLEDIVGPDHGGDVVHCVVQCYIP